MYRQESRAIFVRVPRVIPTNILNTAIQNWEEAYQRAKVDQIFWYSYKPKDLNPEDPEDQPLLPPPVWMDPIRDIITEHLGLSREPAVGVRVEEGSEYGRRLDPQYGIRVWVPLEGTYKSCEPGDLLFIIKGTRDYEHYGTVHGRFVYLNFSYVEAGVFSNTTYQF